MRYLIAIAACAAAIPSLVCAQAPRKKPATAPVITITKPAVSSQAPVKRSKGINVQEADVPLSVEGSARLTAKPTHSSSVSKATPDVAPLILAPASSPKKGDQ
jgi:hypothetical protein